MIQRVGKLMFSLKRSGLGIKITAFASLNGHPAAGLALSWVASGEGRLWLVGIYCW